MNLHDYNLVILNSSGGKDSLVEKLTISQMAEEQGYPKSQIVVSHQDLGEAEWFGTAELVKKQADLFGFKTYYSKRRDHTGHEETFLEYVLRRGMWPSNKQRYCTSDFKRGPGARVVTLLTKDMKESNILYVFGFRSEESPFRNKKEILTFNKKLSTQTRTVHEYLPILGLTTIEIWAIIKKYNLPYHFAYDLGMPRLSCVFCIFSPFDALVIAGYHNRELLDRYIEVEDIIGHTFKDGFSLHEVRDAIIKGYKPKIVSNWIM